MGKPHGAASSAKGISGGKGMGKPNEMQLLQWQLQSLSQQVRSLASMGIQMDAWQKAGSNTKGQRAGKGKGQGNAPLAMEARALVQMGHPRVNPSQGT